MDGSCSFASAWRAVLEATGRISRSCNRMQSDGGLFNQKLLLGKNNRPPEWDCSTCQVRCNSESSISGSLQKKHRAHADAEGIEFLQALQFAAQKCLLTIKLAISIVKQNSVAVDWEA
jgi:hypothetical protein